MKNIKFGVFGLGLLVAVATAVSSLGAQTRVPFDFAQGRQGAPGTRTERPNVMVLDGRGAALGVMVSDVDPKAAPGGVKIDEVNDDSPADRRRVRRRAGAQCTAVHAPGAGNARGSQRRHWHHARREEADP